MTAVPAPQRVSDRRRLLEDTEEGYGEDRTRSPLDKSLENAVTTALGKGGPGRLFSCPFHKWKPAAYQACRSLGFLSVEDVKEHLRVHHAAPIHCIRCYAEFSTIQERDKHCRTVECVRKEFRVMEGCGESTWIELANQTNDYKPPRVQWRALYGAIFPGQEQPLSPYVDVQSTEAIPVKV
ncbi:hypothetical protein NQ176_g6651 [Zarea fungicola]|uniref:Uncharacterized protein n=1 Tax=Zarea fungicola TaxID=93591 RepID=A0ACC1N4J1_9HYPO|nr:hypothetical protein NQ176_g6651 [Lecanicillium fungicola]